MKNIDAAAYRNIVFDLDGTLVHKNPPIFTEIETIFNAHAVFFSDEQRRQAGIWSHRFWNNPDNYHDGPVAAGHNGSNPFWPKYLAFYFELLAIPQDQFDNYYTIFNEAFKSPRAEEFVAGDTHIVLDRLQEARFRLGVLSNRYFSLDTVLERFQLSAFFQKVTAAGELDAYKPDEKIFSIFLRDFGGHPEETLYIGDNYWLDVKSALRAGIQPVLIDPYGWYRDIECPIIQDLTGLLTLLGMQD